jgi:hypothetical protein
MMQNAARFLYNGETWTGQEAVTLHNVQGNGSSVSLLFDNLGWQYGLFAIAGALSIFDSSFANSVFGFTYGGGGLRTGPMLVAHDSSFTNCSTNGAIAWLYNTTMTGGTLDVTHPWLGQVTVSASSFSGMQAFAAQTLTATTSSFAGLSSLSVSDSTTVNGTSFSDVQSFSAGSLAATDSAFLFNSLVIGLPVQSANLQRCTLTGSGHGVGLVVDGTLSMTGCTVSGVDTVLVLNAGSNVVVSGTALLSSLGAVSAAPPYIVENRSPYTANLQGNFWGDAFMAAAGVDAVSGEPTYVLSRFIYDVYTIVLYGEVLFLPFAAAPPPPSPPPPPPPSPRLVNYAPQGTATSSSVYDSDVPPSNAIDNLLYADGSLTGNTCYKLASRGNGLFQTAGSGGWWMVDLGATYTVMLVTIYGRANVPAHSYGLNVFAGASGANGGQSNAQCASAVDAAPAGTNITCSTSARYVTVVQPSSDGYLALCQVQVWVVPPLSPPDRTATPPPSPPPSPLSSPSPSHSPPLPVLSCASSNDVSVCRALSDFFMAVGPSSSMWTGSSGWLEAYHGSPVDYCTFSGLSCSSQGKLVLLEANWINSGYQVSYAPLATLPESLSTLVSLTHLRIANAQGAPFVGTIPASYGSLTNLEFLHLNDMSLSGTIPHELGSLTQLTSLHLHDNFLTGTVPAALGSLVNLNDLYLNGNNLCGEVPASLLTTCSGAASCYLFSWTPWIASAGTAYPTCSV